MEPNYMRPGTGAEVILLINIYSYQFEGCQDEEKPPMRYLYLLWYYCLKFSLTWQYLAGAEARADIMDKGGAAAENK